MLTRSHHASPPSVDVPIGRVRFPAEPNAWPDSSCQCRRLQGTVWPLLTGSAPQPDLNVTEEVQIERRLSGPPVAAPPEPQCRAFTKRRFNEFGELVIRRIRICDEVVRGPALRSPGEPPRREVYGRPIPPTNIPFPPQGVNPRSSRRVNPGNPDRPALIGMLAREDSLAARHPSWDPNGPRALVQICLKPVIGLQSHTCAVLRSGFDALPVQLTLADCAAAPSLFYADWVEEIDLHN